LQHVQLIVDFDSETIKGFKKILLEGLAHGVFLYPDAFRKEIDGNHIAIHLFQKPPHMQKTTLKLLKYYISNSDAKSVISFSENDQALITIATQATYDLKLPFYPYDLENDSGADSQFVRPEVVPCSLILPYSINESQVLEIIERFEQQGPQIKQVIAMINENPSKIEFLQEIEFISISDWDSIKDRIKQFKNLTNEKMSELLANFG